MYESLQRTSGTTKVTSRTNYQRQRVLEVERGLERLEKIADLIEFLPANRYDQNKWGCRRLVWDRALGVIPVPKIAFVGCAYGHAYEAGIVNVHPDTYGDDPFLSEEMFTINARTAWELFGQGYVTPQQKSEQIRAVVAHRRTELQRDGR